MLQQSDKIALFMPGHLQSDYGKMGFGVLRYSKNEIVAVIDEDHAGKPLQAITGIPHQAPIVSTIDESKAKEPMYWSLVFHPREGEFQKNG